MFDINFEFFILFYTLYLLFTKAPTYINILINFELGWVVLYSLTLLFSLKYNLVVFLALTFFILVFSAIELSFGFLIINFTYKLYNNISLTYKLKLKRNFFIFLK